MPFRPSRVPAAIRHCGRHRQSSGVGALTRRAQRGAGFAAIAAVTIGMSGCAGSDRDPTEEWAAINLGVNADVDPIQAENLLVVTRGEGEPARLIGVLLNYSEQDVTVTLSDEDDDVAIALEPGQQFAFQENPTLFDSADDIPGALTNVDITAGGESQTVRVPIRDGSLNWLQPYVPMVDGE